jgi:4-hydroxybenzoate polyprenyltransferase
VPRELEATQGVGLPRQQRSLAWALVVSLRPKQWPKNGLLFMGLVFSRSLHDSNLIARSLVAFVAFCALASSIYLINDVIDLERDRQHPVKRLRPIASGELSPRLALGMAAGLMLGSLALAASLGTSFTIVALFYPILTISYSMWLKHIAIVDVLVVAAGFVLRAVAGAVAITVPISAWLYVCTLLGALFLVTSKRRHEIVLLQGSAGDHRRSLEGYTLPFLDQMISVLASAAVIAYSLYTFSAENLPKNQAMMLTIPFVLYGIFRYLYLIHVKDGGGTPEDALLTDKPLLATVVGWGAVSTFIIYLFS